MTNTNPTFDLYAPGAVDALLKHHRSVFGDLRMEDEPVVTVTPPAPPTIDASNPAVAALIEQARQQEKAKLYSQIESLKPYQQQVEELGRTVESLREKQEREVAEARAAAAKEAEEAARKQWEEKDSKSLLADATKQWEDRFSQMAQAQEAERAAFAKEREMADLKQYAQASVTKALEANEIAPELAHLVTGNNVDEINASLNSVKQTSEAIVKSMGEAMQAQQIQRRGVSPTGYAPVGPMDMTEQSRTLTADQIRDMPMSEYAKIRSQMPGVNQHQSNRGLFG